MARRIVSVTIEGTVMPAAGVLARGERATVAYTPRTDSLVQRGFVKIVERFYDSEGAEPKEDPALDTAPADTARAPVWRKFLESKGVEVPADATRAQMQQAWANIQQQISGGA